MTALNDNKMKSIKKQLRNVECLIRDLPDQLQETIEHNENIDCLFLADTLAKLNDIMDYLSDDENYYASTLMAHEDFPDKLVYIDEWNHKWIPQRG